MTLWVDVIARARGLRTHRLSSATLAAVRAAPDLPTLGRVLTEAGFPLPAGARRPTELDLAVRRRAAAELRTLARWCGSRAAELPVILEDEDRRSLRALFRGVLQHQPAELRLHGLVPTPTLPERALAELSLAQTTGEVVSLLTLWNHPFAAALSGPASASLPDSLALDIALDRVWAGRAITGARHGGRELMRFAGDAIDLSNAATLLALGGAPGRSGPDLFLEGGPRLTQTTFAALLPRDRALAAQALADLFRGTPYAAALRLGWHPGLEDALLAARLDVQRRAARRLPLGVAVILWFALELRAESLMLSRLIWGLTLGAPVEIRLATAGLP
jgi:vacuolar-type H+-ATPase subunit C/Vma6